jgi:hypothetical protein
MKPKLIKYVVIQTMYISMEIEAENEDQAENIFLDERHNRTNRYQNAEMESDNYYHIEKMEDIQ